MTTTQLTEQETSRFVQAGDMRIHYNEAGTGFPVIFVHGGGPGASGWSNFTTNIGPFAEKFRVILVDMPGWGKSGSVVMNEPRFTYNAARFALMLDELGIEKAHFIGNSMGGGSSAKMAIDYPERVEKLVLMGAAGAGPSSFAQYPMEGIKRLNEAFKDPTRETFRAMLEVFVYDTSFVTDALLDQRVQGMLDHPEHREARLKSTMHAGPNLVADLHKIQAETLVVWGRDDRFEPVDLALRFQTMIPNAQAHIFPKCGHWAQYEKADDFNRIVMDFLEH